MRRLFALEDTAQPGLHVVGDVGRLAPAVASAFSPLTVIESGDYLTGIVELSRASSCGVVVGIEPECRRIDAAIRALKRAAGESRVVVCCEPAYEPLTRRLLAEGVDDYVIYPPDDAALGRALQLPTLRTRHRWLQGASPPSQPGDDELSRLAALLAVAAHGGPGVLRDMAALVASALKAESAMVVVDGSVGAVGPDRTALLERATLVQDLHRDGIAVGQIRLGPSGLGAYNEHDAQRLRIYAGLFGRILESAAHGVHWQRLALHDDLTGLPNRRHSLLFLERALARAELDQVPLTVLLFDIDNFKTFNDEYGHDTGDLIIRETAQMFTRCSRRNDFVARYGGDEFLVVFSAAEAPRVAGSQHPQEVITILNRFRRLMSENTFTHLGPRSSGSLTCSGGLARFPWQGRAPEALIAQADAALLAAKRAGKNRFWLVGSGDVCSGTA